jgi:hypothetical protein
VIENTDCKIKTVIGTIAAMVSLEGKGDRLYLMEAVAKIKSGISAFKMYF